MSAALELTVLGEIAQGGMGSVELARLVDETGEHLVAVKRMHREYAADLEFVRMFRDEIWLMAALSHPNLVGLVGWGEDEEGPYLAMEYIDGVALGSIVNAGRRAFDPIPEKLVAYVAARAAEGLAAAHRLCDESGKPLGIVHRDVTPSNLLVGFDGSVKVTDFGIAKAVGKSSHTRTGIIKGKIAYMSPEYASRRPVDGRADLYSLGVVMFEMLTGALPFQARSDFELLKLVAYAAAPTVHSVSPEVDPELAALVDRLLAKSPDERHADGVELAAELDRWLAGRGFAHEPTLRELSAYAARHAGPKRDLLRKLTEDDLHTGPEDASGPRRPRIATLGTRTFTFFDKPWAHEPLERATDDIERPRTRRVAVSEFPPPSVPISIPPPRPSVPPPPPSLPRAALVSSPSVAAAPRLAPVARTRSAHSNAALGGIVLGAGIALVIVLVALAFGRRSREPERELPRAAPPEPQATENVVKIVTPQPDLAPPSIDIAPPPPADSRSPVRPQPKRPAGKPVPWKKPGKPCTIDSFDYPACLSR